MTESRATFRTVIRGYDPIEVDRRLAELTDATVAAQRHASDLHSQVERLASTTSDAKPVAPPPPPPRSAGPDFAALGVHIGQILTAAQKAAGEIGEEATTQAKAKLAAADAAGAKTRGEADHKATLVIEEAKQKAERLLAEAESTAKKRIASAEERLSTAQQLVTDATKKAESIRADSERKLAAATAQRDAVIGELTKIRKVLASAIYVGEDAAEA
jgi:cell division septum initiation protein DivIVA